MSRFWLALWGWVANQLFRLTYLARGKVQKAGLRLKEPAAPEWYNPSEFQEEIEGIPPSLLKVAGNLLGALGWDRPEEFQLTAFYDKTLFVHFGSLQWAVHPQCFRWPVCDVTVYSPKSPDSYGLRISRHCTVDSLLAETRKRRCASTW